MNSLSFIELDNLNPILHWVILVASLSLLALGLWWFWKKYSFKDESD